MRENWDRFWRAIETLRKQVAKASTVQISSIPIRDDAKAVVQLYFRELRSEIESLPSFDVSITDDLMQRVLELANGRGARKSYVSTLKSLWVYRSQIELLLERSSSSLAMSAARGGPRDPLEGRILDTLQNLVPTAGASYEQGCRDLGDSARVSYRGAASELREALRETLDHLAPDDAVTGSPGFKLEKDQRKPTMKQKIRFILRSRGVASGALGAPEQAVHAVEDTIGALARSIYDRSSLSAHTTTARAEVLQLKRYLDAVLAEVLQLVPEAN